MENLNTLEITLHSEKENEWYYFKNDVTKNIIWNESLKLLDNIVMRVVIAFVIVFMATKDPSIALLLAIAFIITMQISNKLKLYNNIGRSNLSQLAK